MGDVKESLALENAKTAPAYVEDVKEAPNVGCEDVADAEKESIDAENLTENTDGEFASETKCEDSKEITGDIAEVEKDVVTNVSSLSGEKFFETEATKRKADSSGDTKQVISEKIAKLEVTV